MLFKAFTLSDTKWFKAFFLKEPDFVDMPLTAEHRHQGFPKVHQNGDWDRGFCITWQLKIKDSSSFQILHLVMYMPKL